MTTPLPWLLVLIYIVPIIGTLASMRRRVRSLGSSGDSLRRLFPQDRFYQKIKKEIVRYNNWRTRYPIASYINLDFLNLAAGKIEYAFGHLRDYTVGLYMMVLFVFYMTIMVFGNLAERGRYFTHFFYYGFFTLLSLWAYRRHVATGLKMTEFMRVNPFVHPEEFFNHYYRHLGPSAIPIPEKAEKTVDPLHTSYLTGKKPKKSYWLLIKGAYDTAIFARSAYKALETIGPSYGRDVFDVMASLWGSRILQLFRTRLVVQGVEKFHSLSGKIILVFNHKSHLDFVFNFFALSGTHRADGRRIRPRYLAAKDHLVDNKFIYSGLGIGKLIENVDMVFVDRKGRGKNAIADAVRRLAEKEIEIAMYPQGTRALGNFGPQGERLDAGFYTTGTVNSLKKDLGHLKKGCSFLALDTAIILKDQGLPVHLVFIGIDGTANLLPKGSFQVETEKTVTFTVGDILTLMPQDVEGLEKPSEKEIQNPAQAKYEAQVDHIQQALNNGLIKSLNLHEKLRLRFLEDVRKERLIPAEKILSLSHKLGTTSDPRPFMILDRIYTLPPREREQFQKEVALSLIQNGNLDSLRDEVTDRLFSHRGKELKTAVLQEKSHRMKGTPGI